MTKDYKPARGSMPDKALQLLRETGRGMTASELAAGTGQAGKNIGNTLKTCVAKGLALRMGQGRGTYWCLPEHSADEFAPAFTRINTRTKRVAEAQPGATEAPPVDDATDLEIAVWHDGDVIVKGGIAVEAHNGGTAMAYSRKQITQLVRMVTRPAVEVAA